MTKEELLKHCSGYENSYHLREKYFKNHLNDIYLEIQRLDYPESFTFQQKLYHYIHNDYELQIGVCPTCGKRTRFITFGKGYEKYCSIKCSCNEERNIKRKKTCFEKYGDENYNNMEKQKKSCLEKYGVENVSNSDVIKEKKKNTRTSKSDKIKSVFKKRIQRTWNKKDKNEHTEKIKKGKLLKYGDENYNNRKKAEETILQLYGDKNYRNHKKMSETARKKAIKRVSELTGYTNELVPVFKCNKTECNKCYAKNYESPMGIYNDRVRFGYETCTKLNPISKQDSGCENELKNYITLLYPNKIVENDRKLLNGKELDIYLPEKKLAFEFNGVYWHSDVYKNKNYHYDKTMSCMDKNIQLIHIWEDDWLNKQDILKNLIRGKLGLHINKINARDCTVKEIDSKTAKAFCETYHIQGYTISKVRLGLYHNNQLVMVCLFTHKRRLIGGKPKEGEWELSRMCSPFDTHVRGGASKLLKHFIRLYNPKSIITFADLSVSNGDVYEKMGFKKEYVVPPTYYWVIDGVRLPRYRFQKSNLQECKEHPELTEREVMESRGSFRCWDAGKIKYVYTPDL